MKGRNAQVSRMYRILHILDGAPQGLTVGEIHSRLSERGFDKDKRTIYRDIEGLQQSGFPLDSSEGEGEATRWKLDRQVRFLEPFVLSASELFALHLAKSFITPLHAFGMGEALSELFQKIEDRLGAKGLHYLKELSQDFYFDNASANPVTVDPEVLETLAHACGEEQLVEVEYQSAGTDGHTKRTLGPEFLYYAKGNVYLIARDMASDIAKVYALPRMKSACMLEETYESGNIDPREFFNQSFGVYRTGDVEKTTITFAPSVATYIQERTWHKSQTLKNNDDGSVTLSLEVSITPEFTQWVMGFGSKARVLEPASLQGSLVNEIKAMAATYE